MKIEFIIEISSEILLIFFGILLLLVVVASFFSRRAIFTTTLFFSPISFFLLYYGGSEIYEDYSDFCLKENQSAIVVIEDEVYMGNFTSNTKVFSNGDFYINTGFDIEIGSKYLIEYRENSKKIISIVKLKDEE